MAAVVLVTSNSVRKNTVAPDRKDPVYKKEIRERAARKYQRNIDMFQPPPFTALLFRDACGVRQFERTDACSKANHQCDLLLSLLSYPCR
jgi:hypothetical protein